MNISFTISDDIPLTLNESPQEFSRDIRFWAAMNWYRKQKLSLGKAAELAGYSKIDFIHRMQYEGESIFDYNKEEIDSVFTDAAKLP